MRSQTAARRNHLSGVSHLHFCFLLAPPWILPASCRSTLPTQAVQLHPFSKLMGTLCCWNNDRAARFQHFAHPQRIRCYLRNCDEHSLGAATGPSAPPVLCFSLCTAMCLVPPLTPAAAGNSQICAWLQRRSMKSHYICTSCSSDMFREVLLQLCDTMGSCMHVPVWCTCFTCALQDACLPCWMLASSLFVCVAAALTTHVNNGCFSLCVDFSCAPTLLSLSN